MIFADDSEQSVYAVRNILQEFYNLLGLEFNAARCEILLSGLLLLRFKIVRYL